MRNTDYRTCGVLDRRSTRHANRPRKGRAETQPFTQLRPASPTRDVAHRDGDGLLLPNQNDKPLAAGDAGVEQIALQHGVVLRHDRNHHGWVFRALALVDARGVRRH